MKKFQIEGEILLLNEDSPFAPENTGTGIPITVEELEENQSTIYCPISNILKQFGMKSYYNILKIHFILKQNSKYKIKMLLWQFVITTFLF